MYIILLIKIISKINWEKYETISLLLHLQHRPKEFIGYPGIINWAIELILIPYNASWLD